MEDEENANKCKIGLDRCRERVLNRVKQNWNAGMPFMRTSNSLSVIGSVAVAALLAAGQASGITAFDNTGVVPDQFTSGPYALGMDFTVNTPILVTSVGAYDAYGNGSFLNPISVAIYNVANQQQVAGSSVTLSGNTWDYNEGSSSFINVAPLTLEPGTYSIVAAGYGASGEEPYYWTNPSDQTTPGFNNGGGLISLVSGGGRWASSATLLFPTTPSGGPPGNPSPNYAAGTFEFTAIPEPSTLALVGLGGLSLLLFSFRKRWN